MARAFSFSNSSKIISPDAIFFSRDNFSASRNKSADGSERFPDFSAEATSLVPKGCFHGNVFVDVLEDEADEDGDEDEETLVSRGVVDVTIGAAEVFADATGEVLRDTQGGTYLVDSLTEVEFIGCSGRVTGRAAGVGAGAAGLGASD